jgi:hypothetical protein
MGNLKQLFLCQNIYSRARTLLIFNVTKERGTKLFGNGAMSIRILKRRIKIFAVG